MHSAIAQHLLNAQPVHEPRSVAQPGAMQYGTLLWPVWVGRPGSVSTQRLAPPQLLAGKAV